MILNIGINALYLLPGKVGGSETYIRNLIKYLTALDSENTYFLFINLESRGIFDEYPPRITIVPCPVQAAIRPFRILWEQLVLPFQLRRHKIDMLLSAGMTAPFFCPCPSVLVIFDLQHINQPHNFSSWYLFFLRTIIYLSAKTADGIITISDNTRQDIVKHYKIQSHGIAITHLAVDHALFFPRNNGDAKAITAKYKLPDRYLLYSAALLPHKNHERLLRTFKQIKKELPGRKLVLSGAWETGQERVVDLIAGLGLQDDVIMLGWIPFEDLPALYSGAEMFLFPSLHEGFGLPILEAMACGVPVVCSRIEPLIEIAENAALLVDPYNEDDIARGILRVFRDKTMRMKLIEAGILRAKTFTWERTAIDTSAFLREIKSRGVTIRKS